MPIPARPHRRARRTAPLPPPRPGPTRRRRRRRAQALPAPASAAPRSFPATTASTRRRASVREPPAAAATCTTRHLAPARRTVTQSAWPTCAPRHGPRDLAPLSCFAGRRAREARRGHQPPQAPQGRRASPASRQARGAAGPRPATRRAIAAVASAPLIAALAVASIAITLVVVPVLPARNRRAVGSSVRRRRTKLPPTTCRSPRAGDSCVLHAVRAGLVSDRPRSPLPVLFLRPSSFRAGCPAQASSARVSSARRPTRASGRGSRAGSR